MIPVPENDTDVPAVKNWPTSRTVVWIVPGARTDGVTDASSGPCGTTDMAAPSVVCAPR